MRKHTPGPWETREVSYKLPGRGKDTRAKAVVMAGKDRRIADCRDEDIAEPEIDEANARLIAAAPDLLEALENAGTLLDESGSQASVDEAARVIRVALAKLEGT